MKKQRLFMGRTASLIRTSATENLLNYEESPPAAGITSMLGLWATIPLPQIQAAAGVISAAFAVISYFSNDTDEKLEEIIARLDRMQKTLDEIKEDLEHIARRLDDIYAAVGKVPGETVTLLINVEIAAVASSIKQFASEAKMGGGGHSEAVKQRLNNALTTFVQKREAFLNLNKSRVALAAYAAASTAAIEITLTKIVMAFEYGDAYGNILDFDGYANSVRERLRVMARDSYLPFLEQASTDSGDGSLDLVANIAQTQKAALEAKLSLNEGQITIGCHTLQTPIEDFSTGKPVEAKNPYRIEIKCFADTVTGTVLVSGVPSNFVALANIWHSEVRTELGSVYKVVTHLYQYNMVTKSLERVDHIPDFKAKCFDANVSQPITLIEKLQVQHTEYLEAVITEIVTVGIRSSVRTTINRLTSFTK